MADAFIVAATRTAGGRRGGRLSGWHPCDLGGAVLDALVGKLDLDPASIDDVVMGCVTQAGEQSFNIGRNVVLSSKLPDSVPSTSVDRQCGSSQQAVHFAAQAVMSGSMDIVIAAGVESMSRVPMAMAIMLPAQNGYGIPRGKRLEARYPGQPFDQFAAAEAAAVTYGFSREAMDEYAFHSHRKAAEATLAGRFTDEILPIEIDGPNGPELHLTDEGIRYDASLESIAKVKLLTEGGRVSAATASQICDGASGVVIMSEQALKATGARPLARIHQMSVIGTDPVAGIDGIVLATDKAMSRGGLRHEDIDLYEISEAFSAAPMAWLQGTRADPGKVNVSGGAIALGHPLGASGTRLMTTLLHALHQRGARYGVQGMCEGAGMANATILERI